MKSLTPSISGRNDKLARAYQLAPEDLDDMYVLHLRCL
jgi:stalled ribosome rescue protein Dom34